MAQGKVLMAVIMSEGEAEKDFDFDVRYGSEDMSECLDYTLVMLHGVVRAYNQHAEILGEETIDLGDEGDE